MSNDEINDYLDYFDEQRVEIRFIQQLDEPPDAVWYAEFYAGDGERQDRDFLLRELEEALTEEGPPPPHTLDVNRTYVAWGASAAAQEILLQVGGFIADHGKEAVGDLVKVGIGAGLARLWNRWKSRKDSGEPLFNRDSAQAKARQVLGRAYDVPEDDLQLAADGHKPDEREWSFHFTNEGAQFSVRLREHGSDLTTVEVERQARL